MEKYCVLTKGSSFADNVCRLRLVTHDSPRSTLMSSLPYNGSAFSSTSSSYIVYFSSGTLYGSPFYDGDGSLG